MGRYNETNRKRIERDFEKKFIGQNDRRKGEHNGNGQNGRREEPLQDFSRIYGSQSRVWQKRPSFTNVDEGVVGVVERKACDYIRTSKIAAVGYILRAEPGEGNVINAYFSKDRPLWWFDIRDGVLSDEQYCIAPDCSLQMIFSNLREPAYHRTFRPHVPEKPNEAFEPHARTLIGGRINDMVKGSVPNSDITDYKRNSEEFMQKAADIFRKAGQY